MVVRYPRRWHGTRVFCTVRLRSVRIWRLIGQGNGVHWSALDEDISVENLLAGRASGKANARSSVGYRSALHLAEEKESSRDVLRHKGYTGRVEFDDEAGYSMVR